MTKAQRVNALIKNGITPEDLSKAYQDGYAEGFREAAPNITKTIYAAVILALRDEKRPWGRLRCHRVLDNVDKHVIDTLNSQEAIDKVWKEIGLFLDFRDALEPIKEVENHG
jgi:hypothetical protein